MDRALERVIRKIKKVTMDNGKIENDVWIKVKNFNGHDDFTSDWQYIGQYPSLRSINKAIIDLYERGDLFPL